MASKGLPELVYSGYHPHAHSWDEFPPLKDILDAVSLGLLLQFWINENANFYVHFCYI